MDLQNTIAHTACEVLTHEGPKLNKLLAPPEGQF